jgi:uncharacterized membrane protein YphA (DoxX/SURF4 family)
MNTTVQGKTEIPLSENSWLMMGAAALASRLVLGWIYWGGATRRLIYDTAKIDPASPGYLANKLVHAAPGVPFGLDGLLHWILSQPLLLQIAVIGFSLVELVVGVGLIIGLGTRLMSLVGLGIAAFLMVVFGWMGTTCLDEWTMAASGFAMAAVTLTTGSGPYSMDHWLLKRGLVERMPWLAWLTSGALPLSPRRVLGIAAGLGLASIAFTVVFYGYNFGAIYSPLHKRVNNVHPHVALSDAAVTPDGRLSVKAYMNAGPDTQGLYVVRALLTPSGAGKDAKPLFDYDAQALAHGNTVTITNRFAPWASCAKITYGLRCQLGSISTLSFALPAAVSQPVDITNMPLTLTLVDVEGKKFQATVPAAAR